MYYMYYIIERKFYSMDTILLKLKDCGCDVDNALKRCVDDEDFLIDCIKMVMCDSNFDILKQSIDNNDTSAAFESAHTLKGIIANMGLTPMLETVNEIVEPLRHGNIENVSENYQKLIMQRDELTDLIK